MDLLHAQIPQLLSPWYLTRREGETLAALGLIVFGQEAYIHTDKGTRLVEQLRAKYGMRWDATVPGGGRWVVDGHELHAGDALQIMTAEGNWLDVRFEVVFRPGAEAAQRGGRVPVFYFPVAGSQLRCETDWANAIFRCPPR